MKIILRNESFEVIPNDTRDETVIDTVKKGFITYNRVKKDGRFIFEPKDKYFLQTVFKNSHTFANSALEEFVFKVRMSGKNDIDVVTDKQLVTNKVKLPFISDMTPRDEQPMFIEKMVEMRKSLIEARTGYGKTFMVCTTMAKIHCRTMIFIRPTYIDKWISDILKYFDVTKEEIYVISGRDSLSDLIESKKKYKFVIASNVTISKYIHDYTNAIKEFVEVPPHDLLKYLGIKLLVSDESHQFFNNLYRSVLALNPDKFIGLSATLITKDARMESMYQSLFPDKVRVGLDVYKKFTHFIFELYSFNNISNQAGSGPFGYSHNNFEQIMLKDGNKRHNYTNMILERIAHYYTDNVKGKYKVLVFAKSLNMIEHLRESIQKKYPDLDIRKYIRGSDYKNISESDIIVSHPDKSGAALDIPDLLYVINTINIDSPAQYAQMSGRLREIPGMDVKFIQLYSSNIIKHKTYIMSNMKYIKRTALSIKWTELPVYI